MSSLYIGKNKPKIVLFGDIMLDHNIFGDCNKIANEAPIPVISFKNEKFSFGGCGNVLINMLKLGADKIFLFSRIGKDINGNKICSLLPKNCINNLIIDESLPTITKTRLYSDNKIIARFDKEITKTITDSQEKNIIDNFLEILNNNNDITSVVFSDYNKGFLSKSLCINIINLCNKFNIPTIVDPKNDFTKYLNCTLIKPNKSETYNLFNIDLNKEPLLFAHTQINTLINCKLSVITLSEDGISVFDNLNHFQLKDNVKNVIDVTGAGDIICAIFGVYYYYINDLHKLIKIANHIASISIEHIGVYTINDNDLFETYKFIHNTKLISPELITNLNIDNFILTNGCFDILHTGHIELFKFCKNLNGKLIVALNSDISIKNIKGNSRPINNLSQRIKILESISYIDFIIVFDENTPFNLIKNIKPKYLVKGGDYTLEQIIGKEFAENTIIFNYINGFSTTNIINNIKKNEV
jgi:D-beta-D-heptose 7-phosphate kinase/D-beta-D-heptose 1-phosphate adenosyltransferase